MGDLEQYFGKHNVPFELGPDTTAKKKKFNKDVGGTLYLSFSVMDDHKLEHVSVAEAAAQVARRQLHHKDGGRAKMPSSKVNSDSPAPPESVSESNPDPPPHTQAA